MKKLFILSLTTLASLNAKSIETTNPGLQDQTETQKQPTWQEIGKGCSKEAIANALTAALLIACIFDKDTWGSEEIQTISAFTITGALSKLILHPIKPINETNEPLTTKSICKNIAFETFGSLISTSASVAALNTIDGKPTLDNFPNTPLIFSAFFLATKVALFGATKGTQFAYSKFKKSSSKDKETNTA